jgi:hypothetical protein
LPLGQGIRPKPVLKRQPPKPEANPLEALRNSTLTKSAISRLSLEEQLRITSSLLKPVSIPLATQKTTVESKNATINSLADRLKIAINKKKEMMRKKDSDSSSSDDSD